MAEKARRQLRADAAERRLEQGHTQQASEWQKKSQEYEDRREADAIKFDVSTHWVPEHLENTEELRRGREEVKIGRAHV